MAALALVTACGGETSDGRAPGAGAGGTATGGTGGSSAGGAGGASSGGAGTGGAAAQGNGGWGYAGEQIFPCWDEREGEINKGDAVRSVDGCNTCSCSWEGVLSCTERPCVGCLAWGVRHGVGSTFLAADGCNVCTCEAHDQVSCTALPCACDPAQEWWRHYVSLSPDCDVAAIPPGFPGSCAPPHVAFKSACGCGCQQDPNCPPVLDCTTTVWPECRADLCPRSEVRR